MDEQTLKDIAMELASVGHVRYWLTASSMAPGDPRELMAIGARIGRAAIAKEWMSTMEDQGFELLRFHQVDGFVMVIEKTQPKQIIAHPAIDAAHEKDEFGKLEDGYQHWLPSTNGPYDFRALKALSEELQRLNKAWNDQVQAFLRP
jgi:hypothetical protein